MLLCHVDEAKKSGVSSNEGVMSTMAVVAVETQTLEQRVADTWKETLYYLQMNSNFCSLSLGICRGQRI